MIILTIMKTVELISNRIYDDSDVDSYSLTQASDLSLAFSKVYLPRLDSSRLKQLIYDHYKISPRIRLTLHVSVDIDGKTVKGICPYVVEDDQVDYIMTGKETDLTEANRIAAEYFRSIGYDIIDCNTNEAVVTFIERLSIDMPSANKFFRIVESEI